MDTPRIVAGEIAAQGRKIAIAAARFNEFIVASLLKGAVAAFRARGGADQDLLIARVPGAFELPLVARRLAGSGRFEAVVALGCVIRGETPHFDYIAGECARGLQWASLESGIPIVFGVLTVETMDQALERAAVTSGNKGGESMDTALEMAALMAQLRDAHER